jgi:flagellar motility protein MotE (MotC chaperone)
MQARREISARPDAAFGVLASMTPQKAALLRTRLKGLARKVNAAYLWA